MTKEIKMEIVKEISVLSEDKSSTLELNLIKWNDGAPKYDLRKWGREHKAYKGITFTRDEAKVLYLSLKNELGLD